MLFFANLFLIPWFYNDRTYMKGKENVIKFCRKVTLYCQNEIESYVHVHPSYLLV